MGIECIDDVIIVYLNYIDSDIDELCHKVVNILNNHYNLNVKGYYRTDVYVDSNYGIVIEYILEDRNLYIDFSKIDLYIRKIETTFLFKIDDILDIDISNFIIYNGNYYIYSVDISNKNIDFGKLVYKNTEQIINNGINMCKYYNKMVEKS